MNLTPAIKQTLGLSDPWQIFRSKLKTIFEMDDSVNVGPVVDGDDGSKSLTLTIASHTKAAAWRTLLESQNFGNVGLDVNIVDTAEAETPADILHAAFAGNRIVRRVETKTDPTGFTHTYLKAEPAVLQFFGDNTGDPDGNISLLAEDALRDVLTLAPGTTVCTANLREN